MHVQENPMIFQCVRLAIMGKAKLCLVFFFSFVYIAVPEHNQIDIYIHMYLFPTHTHICSVVVRLENVFM